MQRFQEFFEDHPLAGIAIVVLCLVLGSIRW